MKKFLKDRSIRRCAANLLRELVFLPRDDQHAALDGAGHLLEGLAGVPPREAARLFAKLPPDPDEATRVLRLLRLWVRFVETGIADRAEVEAVGCILVDAPPRSNTPHEVLTDNALILDFRKTVYS